MEKTLYFIRHCSAEGQPFEAELTEEGKEQAQQLVRFFADIPIDLIISSPYVRAVQTIEPFASSRHLKIETDERLGERVLSSGVLEDWLEKLRLSFENLDLFFEGGESSSQAINRSKEVIDELLMNDKQDIIVVSHGNLTTLMLKTFDNQFGFEEWRSMSNPDVYKIVIQGKDTTVKRIWS
ncbi:histidine phosphatase family protein [Bacillus luteolus]|uniref:Histidine phosphatase family protein n=1 Tax=Litchfieldia luteola TaxID=682179 RepID=A0ABR9QPI4_9BACI|nr:histidine phosphatase family protein [Cytobacillus luteolus]MBE4910403.1 histidine phosphatase family protein [Cytobacillus luteolus]MBP1942021.1 2,3-bisphosphoglycerate-dependent phosphoglycerate mutase [Cytobacillus luteolus]